MLEDIKPRIARFRDEEEYDPVRLEVIEERLQLLNKIKRKYGGTIAAASDYLMELKNQRRSLEDLEYQTRELEERKQERWKEYRELAAGVSSFRHQAARALEARIEEELAQLSMPG